MQENTLEPARIVDPSSVDHQMISIERKTLDIFGPKSKLTLMKKAQESSGKEKRDPSAVGASVGIKPQLINKNVARELRDYNATHAICLDAKIASSLGLGHRHQEIHEILNPLCRFNSWQDTLTSLAEDFWEGGDAYLEVVLDEDDHELVTGLNALQGPQVEVDVEEEGNTELFHYEVSGDAVGSSQVIMARFGDFEDLRTRYGVQPKSETSEGLPIEATRNANDAPEHSSRAQGLTFANSVIVHFRQPTNKSPYYGYPDYMSAVPSIELVQCMTQHEFDFYFNRGVPEFMMFLIGKNIGNCWSKITSLLGANQGLGNSHKTGAVHIPGSPDDMKVQIEKLAMDDAANSGFAEKSATLDMRIATAHGMPPQLANIALPGKIGASNEGPNAMLTFQQRKLGQAQKLFSNILAMTLGSEGLKFNQPTGAPKTLKAEWFLGKGAKPIDDNGVPQFVQPGNGFNTILDGMTLGAQNTMASMKEPLAGSGRNPEDGNLTGARDRKPTDPKATRGPGTGK